MTALLAPRALKTLSIRSDRRGLGQLAGHLGAIGAAVVLVLMTRGGPWVWPAMAVLGVLEMALFAPLHETTHRTPFRSLALNRIVGWVAGFLLLLPPEWFRLFHLAHHRHTQDPERDPELIGAPPLTPRRYWWTLTGVPYWTAQAKVLVRAALGRAEDPWMPAARRRTVAREARVYLALYAALAVASVISGSTLALTLWVVPALLGQPVLRWVLLAEHGGCPVGDDRLANTRTTLASRLFARLFWNANYHAEHHLAPGVPFHALPRLHLLVRGRLHHVEPSYPRAHTAIRHGTTALRA